ncbi:unnamed protein product [Trichogramma brassicae]|uniref:Uncharacterized protein n=1 Tax=Trichogramma brassicae TaxID=86971 RepID=A0A6H5IW94_9HYME|nr:unnamed protein product [Trichogramma brassicae]
MLAFQLCTRSVILFHLVVIFSCCKYVDSNAALNFGHVSREARLAENQSLAPCARCIRAVSKAKASGQLCRTRMLLIFFYPFACYGWIFTSGEYRNAFTQIRHYLIVQRGRCWLGILETDVGGNKWRLVREIRDIGRRVDELSSSLNARMDAIVKVQAESRAKIDDNTREINRLKIKIGNMEENAMHYADMCEIRFSGLPDLPDVRDIDSVATVLKVLECDERILSVRRWMPSRASNTPSTSTNATLVARFSSPVARDAIMSCTHKLAMMTGGSIFGTEDQGKVFAFSNAHTTSVQALVLGTV